MSSVEEILSMCQSELTDLRLEVAQLRKLIEEKEVVKPIESLSENCLFRELDKLVSEEICLRKLHYTSGYLTASLEQINGKINFIEEELI